MLVRYSACQKIDYSIGWHFTHGMSVRYWNSLRMILQGIHVPTCMQSSDESADGEEGGARGGPPGERTLRMPCVVPKAQRTLTDSLKGPLGHGTIAPCL